MCSTRVPLPDAQAFWSYSVAVYGRKGVAAALLTLQDRHGADVNLMLLACWAAKTTGRALSTGEYRTLEAAVGDWRRTVVEPIRSARRASRRFAGAEVPLPPGREDGMAPTPVDGAAALRARLLEIELDAERAAQGLLVAACDLTPEHRQPGAPDPAVALRLSLGRYLRLLGAPAVALDTLAPLLAAVAADLTC